MVGFPKSGHKLCFVRKSHPYIAIDDSSLRTMKEWLVCNVPKQTFTFAVPVGKTLLPSALMSCIPSAGCNCSTEMYLLLITEQEAPESNSIKVE